MLVRNMNATVGDIRSERKFFSISGSLTLMLLLLFATQSACRPSDESSEGFDVDSEFADVDNVEWHHVKLVDGVMHEDHPIIMYKEDFVSEDYDPTKNQTTNATTEASVESTRPTRKYKDIAHRRRRLNRTQTEHYRALKPEKIYFDILPPTPIVVSDDSSADDSKFDISKIHVDVISLADDVGDDAKPEEPSKELLSKRPKKYHRRNRRDTHSIIKRNPYYQIGGGEAANSATDFFRDFYNYMRARPQAPVTTPVKHHVPGKLWNSINLPVSVPDQTKVVINNRVSGDDSERVVWGSSIPESITRPLTTVRPSTRRTPPPLFHDSNPSNSDFSFFTTRRPNTSRRPPTRRTPPPLFHNSNPSDADFSFFTTRRPTTTRYPSTRRTPPPLFHDSKPENADFSFFTPRPNNATPNTSIRAPEAHQDLVSTCVWAIVNCCSNSDYKIRYSCFEELGCHGAFWDLNPCADSVKDNFINYVSDQYE